MPESHPSFAEYVRQIMRADELSESELARRSGLAQPTINRILNEQRTGSFRLDTLQALANGLGIPLPQLVKAATDAGMPRYKDDRFAFYADRFDAKNFTYSEWQFIETNFKDVIDRFKAFKTELESRRGRK